MDSRVKSKSYESRDLVSLKLKRILLRRKQSLENWEQGIDLIGLERN